MNPEDQIILIDKPAGISSFGVVAKIRGYLRAKYGNKVKVGHTGTLDPFATGLLIILTGKNTKKSDEFLKKDKVYEATLKLGFVSTTGDPEGEITEYKTAEDVLPWIQECPSDGPPEPGKARMSAPRPCRRAEATQPELDVIESTIQSFIGKIKQKVPTFSAVKINGERAYKLARAGKDFETPEREVTIYNIEVLNYNYPELKIRCHVSSGTYIRTLAEDIGKKLGTGAYLTALRRLKIAAYDVKDAKNLTDFTSSHQN